MEYEVNSLPRIIINVVVFEFVNKMGFKFLFPDSQVARAFPPFGKFPNHMQSSDASKANCSHIVDVCLTIYFGNYVQQERDFFCDKFPVWNNYFDKSDLFENKLMLFYVNLHVC